MNASKNLDRIFVKVEEFNFLKKYYKVILIIKSVETILENYFYVNLNDFIKYNDSCFYIVDNSSKNYYFCPKILIDNDNPDKLTVTVLIDNNYVKKEYMLVSFKIFEYPKNFEYNPPYNFNCVNCLDALESEKKNDIFYVEKFWKATKNCQGIDLVLNNSVILLPLEEKVLEIKSFFKFGYSKLNCEEHLFFLRSRFLRKGIVILNIYYQQDDVHIKILNTKIYTVDLTNRFLQVCCPNNENKFCSKHFRLPDLNSFRKSKINKNYYTKDQYFEMASRYSNITEDSICENFYYILDKTLKASDNYLEEKNLEKIKIEDLNFEFSIETTDGAYILNFSHHSEICKKRRKILYGSMKKITEQLVAFLLTIIPDEEEAILSIFDISKNKDIKYSKIIFIDGHVAEGKTEKVKKASADVCIFEFDNLLRANDALILKKHSKIISIMYFCQLFCAFHKKWELEEEKSILTMVVDRSPLSHFLFAHIDDKQNEKDLNSHFLLKFKLTELFIFISFMLASSDDDQNFFEVEIIENPKPFSTWFEKRKYEKELYEECSTGFETLRLQFRKVLKELCMNDFNSENVPLDNFLDDYPLRKNESKNKQDQEQE
jgi:hypothetical protein